MKEVAEGARARMMWLTVADYNPNAIAFYNEYGFKKTQVRFHCACPQSSVVGMHALNDTHVRKHRVH